MGPSVLRFSLATPNQGRSSLAPGLLGRTRPLRRYRRTPAARRSDEGGPSDFTEEVTVFLTDDGLIRLPSRHIKMSSRNAAMPTFKEHGLCIGASFQVQATNGNDPSRRISMLGFCRSVGHLSEQVEDTVQQHGGLITFKQCRELDSGLSESLKLIVAIPFLWGVPPAWELLSSAITMGGGVIDKTYRQWRF
ncbi:hypothetical protein WJX74_008861 [Apatococcus lobatus]|uniref:DUF7811 domain-containing protein n=2 Tax=Apatococcus TaxID=904362 RepID=A0AAW1SUN2_9CHLO